MSLSDAMKMPISFEKMFYESEVWKARQQQIKDDLKHEADKYNGLIKLGNAVIKGLNKIADPTRR